MPAPEPAPLPVQEPAKGPEPEGRIVPFTGQRQPPPRPEGHKLLPQSEDAEKGILASFMLEPHGAGRYCIERGITPRHFHNPAHAEIYEALTYLAGERMLNGDGGDFIVLTQFLRDTNRLEHVGGAFYVTGLYTFLPTAANVGQYVEIVHEKHELRAMIALCTSVASRCYAEQDNLPGLLEALDGKVADIRANRNRAGLRSILDNRLFDAAKPPAEPRAVLMLGAAVIATPENFMLVQAKVKAGKTAVSSAIMAATMEPTGDCLGFSSSNPEGFAVIHFDTEQSQYHHHTVISRTLARAGRKVAPSWLFSYYLKGLTVDDLLAALRLELEDRRKQCGGIHMVLLDGIADFCRDVNNPEEAVALVATIERLCVEYQTVFVCIIHENPGSEIGKTRGHLGSQLERKAETPLRLEKDADGVTVMFADRARTSHITKDNGPRFAWSDEAKMHVSTTTAFKSTTKAGQRQPGDPRVNARGNNAKSAMGAFFAHGVSHRRYEAEEFAVANKVPVGTFNKYWDRLKLEGWIEHDKAVPSLWSASSKWAAELAMDYPEEPQ
jgi:hypothetical protein